MDIDIGIWHAMIKKKFQTNINKRTATAIARLMELVWETEVHKLRWWSCHASYTKNLGLNHVLFAAGPTTPYRQG